MFNLTRQEKTVILFLIGVALIGVGVNFLFKQYINTGPLKLLTLQKPKINLNNATEEELISLPGIGPALARRIIEYRDTQGNFTDLQDLKNIKGIRNQTLEEIKDFVVIE